MTEVKFIITFDVPNTNRCVPQIIEKLKRIGSITSGDQCGKPLKVEQIFS